MSADIKKSVFYFLFDLKIHRQIENRYCNDKKIDGWGGKHLFIADLSGYKYGVETAYNGLITEKKFRLHIDMFYTGL